jgi:hypothetical protein
MMAEIKAQTSSWRNDLLQEWRGNRVFRWLMSAAMVWFVLRLVVHLGLLYTSQLSSDGISLIPIDMQLYVDGARALLARQPLYQLPPTRIEIYQYPPVFAWAFAPWLALPDAVLVGVQTALRLAAYAFLIGIWGRIFSRLGWGGAWARSLPLWLICTDFWSDLAFGNLYMVIGLLATLAFEAIQQRRLGWAILWLTCIVQIKPHWAFVILLPFLFGEWRWGWKLVIGVGLACTAVIGVMCLSVGVAYGWQQHLDFLQLLSQLSPTFPWRHWGTSPFFGYNHALAQVVLWFLADVTGGLRIAAVIKLVFLVITILMLALGQAWRERWQGRLQMRHGVLAFFLCYIAIFFVADQFWELSLALPLYIFLTASTGRGRRLAQVVFLPFFFLDIWRLVSAGIAMSVGVEATTNDGYILTDPLIYFPFLLVILLTGWGLLLYQARTKTPGFCA